MASPMIEIPSGEFMMGSGDSAEHIMWVDSFAIDSNEVNNAEFVDQFPDHKFPSGAEPHPVTNISWQKAKEFCQRSGKRLPTESEWEKSARGTNANIYPWGNKAPHKKPHPFFSGVIKRRVGLNKRDVSLYGVLGMAGSVWEWTQDSVGEKIITRGGLWNHHLDYEYSKTYERNLIAPNDRFIFLGFRCAR